MLIEKAGPGLQLVQELRNDQTRGFPRPIGIVPEGDKWIRMGGARDDRPLFRGGKPGRARDGAVAFHSGKMQQHCEPRGAFHQSADRRSAQADDQVAFPVSGYGPISCFRRSFTDHDLRRDEGFAPPAATCPRHAQCPSRAKAGGQLTTECAAALYVERLIDRLMTDPHRLILGPVPDGELDEGDRVPLPEGYKAPTSSVLTCSRTLTGPSSTDRRTASEVGDTVSSAARAIRRQGSRGRSVSCRKATRGCAWKRLVETSPVGVVVFDARSGAPVSLNREARRIVESLRSAGSPAEQLLEVMTFRRADGREIALGELPLAATLSGAETVRAEEIVLSVPDGRSVTTLVNATPIHGEDGAVVSMVVTLQDLAPLHGKRSCQ